MEWGPIFAGGVAGLGSGVIGSLVAPWVQLAVENRRNKRRRHEELVERWRAMVARHHQPRHLASDGLVDDPDFLSIRPHLSPAIRERLETEGGSDAKPIEIVMGATGISANSDLSLLVQEIDRLEREWRLT